MTHTVAVAANTESTPARPPGGTTAAKLPVHRPVTAYVAGGFDGVTRVVMLLHSRRYAVRSLSVEIREGTAESRVSCTILLTEPEACLLLARLRRIPTVVSAEDGFEDRPPSHDRLGDHSAGLDADQGISSQQ